MTYENDVKSYFSVHKVLLGYSRVLIYMLSMAVVMLQWKSGDRDGMALKI